MLLLKLSEEPGPRLRLPPPARRVARAAAAGPNGAAAGGGGSNKALAGSVMDAAEEKRDKPAEGTRHMPLAPLAEGEMFGEKLNPQDGPATDVWVGAWGRDEDTESTRRAVQAVLAVLLPVAPV
jgi:hypothetical protein